MNHRRAQRPDWANIVRFVRRHALLVTFAAIGAIALAGTVVVFGPELTGATEPSTANANGSQTNGAAATSGGAPASAGPSVGSPVPSRSGTASLAPARPPAATGFPGPSNTGVPAGTKLSTYSGPCTITTNNTVIDAKVVNCGLSIRAKGVVIKRSRINGQVGTSESTPYSYTLQDSEVDAGVVQGAAIGSTNMTILRVNVHGGATSVYCYSNCTIRDSWLHGQRLPAGVDWHLGAFLANDNGNDPGGRTNAMLVHNSIICDATPNSSDGGCSGNINLYGDFGVITYVTLDNNLFGASVGASYCVYGGQSTSKPYPNADHVVVVNNVFQRGTNGKCGAYGPVTAFDPSRPGNRWTNNVWDNGGTVPPAN